MGNLKEDLIDEIAKLKERFINDKATSENFNDEQVGMIKCWLEQAYTLGKENAKTECLMDKFNDEDFDKFKNGVFKMFGEGNEDLNHWKNMYQVERNIVALLSSEVYSLLCMVDKDRYNYAAMGVCGMR